MMRFITIALLFTSGCMMRQITSIQDGPLTAAGQTTLLTTFEVQDFGVAKITKQKFWDCENQNGKLVCRQSCDIKDDQGDLLACPTHIGGAL